MENIKTIEVKIEGKEWQDALDKAFKEANKKAKIDGFRPGHAPKEVFIKKYGEESLFMDAADKALQSAYVKVLEENKDLEIVTQPSVELKNVSKDALELTFKLILKPEFKLGDYKNLKVKKDKVEVTNEEVNSAIDEMKNRYAEVQVKDGKVEKGDTAVIDFEGFKDGVAFEGGKGENYSLKIGSNTFIPGFEDQIIGMSKGEEKDVKVTFPEDYHSEELKGQPVVFKVKVNEIKEKHSELVNSIAYIGKVTNFVTIDGDWSKDGRKSVTFTVKEGFNPYIEIRLCGNSIFVSNIQIEEGTTATPYEPYHEPITTPIYLPTPLYSGEVMRSDGTITRSDGTTETFTAPQIPTLNGTTVIDVDTAVKPESMTIKYKGV